jgi:hypothetical protein
MSILNIRDKIDVGATLVLKKENNKINFLVNSSFCTTTCGLFIFLHNYGPEREAEYNEQKIICVC